MSNEDIGFFEIWRDRILWTLALGTAASATLYLIHFASGWPHEMSKACLIAYGVWGAIAWFFIDNAD
jgi:hypothetical protein